MDIKVRNRTHEDLVGRHSQIENLTRLTQSVNGPLVMSINGEWGTGKTTFIELWQKYLDSGDANNGKRISSVYFNAWESDYVDDPLIPLMAVLDELNGDKAESPKWMAAKKLLPKLAKVAIGAGVKFATLNALDLDKAHEAVIADGAKDGSKDLVDSFFEQSEATNSIQDGISSLVEKDCVDQKNLIIFIDELDRCRPTYSIETLERIKHLFSVESVIFVLVFDKEQLCHSICSVYGEGFNGSDYLKRFVDVEFKLKTPDVESYILCKVRGLPYSVEHKARLNWDGIEGPLVYVFSYLSVIWSIPLRQINQLLTRFMLVSCMAPEENNPDLILAAILIILREKMPDHYMRFLRRPNESVVNLLKEIKAITHPDYEYHKGRRVFVSKLISVCENGNDSDFEQLQAPYVRTMESANRHTDEYQFYRQIVSSIRNLATTYHDGGQNHLAMVANQVELMDSVVLDGNIESNPVLGSS